MNNKSRQSSLIRRPICAAIVGLAAAGSLAYAADPMTSATGGNVASADRTFIQKAAIGGMTEVAASELAQQKATDPAVKDYAAHMVTDHTKANGELTTLAASKGVTVPGTMDKSHKSDVDKLAKMSGGDFDKAYVKQMVSDHKSTVSLFEKEQKSGKDGDLQAFAGKTLPTLQGHLQTIEGIKDNMK